MDINKPKYDFNDFVEIIKILRSPNGCPWDRAQTHETIKSNLIEESYEFLSEIDKKNIEGMQEELGDVLLQVVMHAEIAKSDKEFDINDVIDGIAKKMIFRHPHVFEAEKAQTKPDFYTKMTIALKEANETSYWLRLLHKTSYLKDGEFESIYKDIDEICSILVSITKTTKENISK
jgi:tetrapyrrole methylase family protein/MazG family protein